MNKIDIIPGARVKIRRGIDGWKARNGTIKNLVPISDGVDVVMDDGLIAHCYSNEMAAIVPDNTVTVVEK